MASKNKGGRPSLYETKIKPHLKTIAILREQGVSHDDIVKLMGISKTTYYKYMILIDEFVNAIKNGDKELVNNAKMSLGKLVSGYDRTITTYKYKYIDGVEVLCNKDVRVEQVGPEPSSVYFALVNKSNGEFKHRDNNSDSEEYDTVEPTVIEKLNNESD